MSGSLSWAVPWLAFDCAWGRGWTILIIELVQTREPSDTGPP